MRIFLTGGRGGIGSAISRTLKERGIVLVEPTSEKLNLDSPEFEHFQDLTEYDGFIHCAGVNTLCDYNSLDSHDFYSLFNINTLSFVSLCSRLNIKRGGNIIAIGSLYATETKERRIQYSMSKHALLAAVKTIALEKGSHGVPVNMVSPGFVDTPMTRKNNTQERLDFLSQNIPLGMVNSEEIANMCLYLITQNKAITGQNIVIDGGYSLKGI